MYPFGPAKALTSCVSSTPNCQLPTGRSDALAIVRPTSDTYLFNAVSFVSGYVLVMLIATAWPMPSSWAGPTVTFVKVSRRGDGRVDDARVDAGLHADGGRYRLGDLRQPAEIRPAAVLLAGEVNGCERHAKRGSTGCGEPHRIARCLCVLHDRPRGEFRRASRVIA